MATRRAASPTRPRATTKPATKAPASKPARPRKATSSKATAKTSAAKKASAKTTAKKTTTKAAARKPVRKSSTRTTTPRPAKETARRAARKTASKKARKRTPRDAGPVLAPEQRPPAEVTRDLFLVWRFPRTGARNPHELTNASWVWLARNRELNAYMANRHFDGPSSLGAGPAWCASRFGRTDTVLPDGRSIAIAGEHEDSYDPDFFIYNDVIVTAPSGEVTIFGYPPEVFPPTDFHTATLVGDRIVILGCLGHPSQRRCGHTPLFALDTTSLAISPLVTTGDGPGWIHKHTADLASDGASIVVRGGEVLDLVGDTERLRDNFDDWSLDLATLTWTRLTTRPWTQWDIVRADGSSNQLFTLSNVAFYADNPSFASIRRDDIEQLGFEPDLALFAARYAPPFAHESQPGEYAYPYVHTIVVDDIRVRYVEESEHVRITIEGELDPAKTALLIEDARQKISTLDHSEHVVRKL